MEFTPEQAQRYSRHIILPAVGGRGQRALAAAGVAVIGAGGLGCPAALYLAAAGVGRIGVVDGDRVELSNLQRQVLYTDADIGKPKAEVAAERLRACNPHTEVAVHNEMLTRANALEILSRYDVVVNGADNFAARYLVNDAAYLLGKPLADGAVLAFEGQASTYLPGRGCYRCLFPSPPPAEDAPNCADAGVLGALPGMVGSIQAMEAIKIIIGAGRTLDSRLLVVDALRMEFSQVEVRRDPECALCGDSPSITELQDYERLCAQR